MTEYRETPKDLGDITIRTYTFDERMNDPSPERNKLELCIAEVGRRGHGFRINSDNREYICIGDVNPKEKKILANALRTLTVDQLRGATVHDKVGVQPLIGKNNSVFVCFPAPIMPRHIKAIAECLAVRGFIADEEGRFVHDNEQGQKFRRKINSFACAH